MNYLASKLKNYYQRKGNKIIFQNGDSLNKLALQMGDELNFCFDGAGLSRILSGKRLFTAVQLDAFCKVLNFSDDERVLLYKALAKDLLQRAGIREKVIERKSVYNKILEMTVINKHEFIESINELGNVDAALFLKKLKKKLKMKYPEELEKQKHAFLFCIEDLNKKSRWVVFRL